MKTGYDQQRVVARREEEHVGETPQERTTSTSQDRRKLQWVRRHTSHSAVDLSLETPA
jgi:hypothetical protein